MLSLTMKIVPLKVVAVYGSSEEYLGVALSSVIAKVLEFLMLHRLEMVWYS